MDPMNELPAEIVLRVLDFASLGSLAALTQTSRAWHDFIDKIHQEAIYAARVPDGSPSMAPDTHFSGLAAFRSKSLSGGIKTWKEACRRRSLLADAWNSPDPRPRVFVIQVGNRPVWRFKPDFKRRIIVSTSQAGGVNVTDMDRGTLLWSLGHGDVRPFAHLEYQDGTAVWDRFGNALEVWKTDLPGCARGEFRQVAMLPHDTETRGFQLSFDTLSVVSTEGEGFVYNIPPSCPDTPVTLRTHLDIAQGAIGHLDQDRDVVMYSMGTNGYHFHDKNSGDLLGTIRPQDVSEAQAYHIAHPSTFLSDPSSIIDIIGGLGDMVSTQTGLAFGPQNYRERLTPIKIRPGHLSPDQRAVDVEAEAQHSIPPVHQDEWGAGMLKGNTMVGVSRGGRLVVCWDWRRAVRSTQDMVAVTAVVECEPSGDSNFDLGGWLSIHETVAGKRVIFEVKERIYFISLGEDGGLNMDKPAFAVAPSIAPQITVPVSFMGVYDDCLMSTFATLGMELEEDDEDPEGQHGRERYFPTKAIRVLCLEP
ncbi:hypothetical protein VP1G_06431 [Cytospora mali]|uniref:F-box domain-containing protein n=1 Tax=Cytospora mali TaxID=578113 RepID=A0A194V5C4_CYTMA|nr:hypothetical protein VP1G_06431 [Valsa mali var. pyri (nom. inval.)]